MINVTQKGRSGGTTNLNKGAEDKLERVLLDDCLLSFKAKRNLLHFLLMWGTGSAPGSGRARAA